MKIYNPIQLTIIISILFTACTGQKNRIILRPEPGLEKPYEVTSQQETWQIIESQNGLPENGIPDWVNLHMNNKTKNIESLDQYNNKYVFIGESQGTNFNALEQWARSFSATQDFPRLLTKRVEQRLISTAMLYPDDEYGEYFEILMKSVSNSEYPAAKEQIFWIKQLRLPDDAEDASVSQQDQAGVPPLRYKIFILLSIDKDSLQNQINQITAGIKTSKSPTRDQATAINRIKNNFFTGF